LIFIQQLIERFKKLYSSVDDIDLFIAGVNEAKPRNSYVGPTFQCIIANQFLNLKRGDRYFYDLQGQPGSFSKGMKRVIESSAVAIMPNLVLP
jgi:peroxidase